MYWLPKLHKRPYKARFIANSRSSSCTTTELSKLLTSCLTAVKSRVIKYYETVYERSRKNVFWSIKHSGEVFSKLKSRVFHATIAFCIRVRTSLIFSSVKLLQSKTQSLLPGVGGVSMVISCQNYTHCLPMALMFVYKGNFTHSKFKPIVILTL